MNPSTIRNPSQLYKVREAYLANLELEQRNLQKTADAVSILKQTGQAPIPPQDTRTVNEKIGDIEKLKISLRRQLMDITDGQQAADIMNALSNDEIQALSIVYGDISSVLKAKYASGVPAPIFLEYVRRYLKDYSKNVGIASGNQGVAAEELKLTRDMIQRVMPSPPIMEELGRALAMAPNSRLKGEAVDAVERLARAFPDINDIAATQSILSEVELANLSDLITTALDTAPSAEQIKNLTKDIINSLRSGSKSESDDILKKTLATVKMQADEMAQLINVSAALRQEQEETSQMERQKSERQKILEPSPQTAEAINEVARIVGSTLKEVQVRTGEKRITRRGKEVLVTEPRTQLVAKRTVTDAELKRANDIFLLDRLTAEELASTVRVINKPGLVGYWDYLSKRDRGVGLTDEELAELAALTKDELKQRIIDFKAGRELGRPGVRQEKAAAKQETAADIGGISAGARLQPKAKLNIEQKAIFDNAQKQLMDRLDFAALDDTATQLEYLGYLLAYGAFDGDADLKADVEDLVARDPTSLKQMTVAGIYDRVKRVTGMGMTAKKRSKAQNIVFGCGLAKSASRPKKEFSEKIDFSEGLPKDKSYIPFGKYVIHKHKLTGGILQVRTVKGGAIPKLPTLGISPSLGKIIKKMVGGGLPTYDEMSALSEDEKNTLYKVFKLSNIDKADMLPSPDKTKEETEMNRFQILKGQIQAGNDSAELIKEFKLMLMRFISGGKIPRGQGMDIVCELMSLGY
jgi:hypothetical protein